MRQPAHDHLVARNHLLAINAQVLAAAGIGQALRPARHHQPPGDERPGVARPTPLHGQLAEVDLTGFKSHLLARGRAHHGGFHVPHGLDQMQKLARVFQALGWLGLLQCSQQMADIAQISDVLGAHAERHAFGRAKQIGQHREFVTVCVGEQERRAFLLQHRIGDGRHFQACGNGLGHAAQLASAFQSSYEFAQITVLHIE